MDVRMADIVTPAPFSSSLPRKLVKEGWWLESPMPTACAEILAFPARPTAAVTGDRSRDSNPRAQLISKTVSGRDRYAIRRAA
jgi:hypothetical protein